MADLVKAPPLPPDRLLQQKLPASFSALTRLDKPKKAAEIVQKPVRAIAPDFTMVGPNAAKIAEQNSPTHPKNCPHVLPSTTTVSPTEFLSEISKVSPVPPSEKFIQPNSTNDDVIMSNRDM